MSREFLSLSAEVALALTEGKPVVALESTIISHGMPFPQNLETAQLLESEVRAAGAVPATIALMDGKICIGLDENKLHQLATQEVAKVSRRDMPVILATGAMGATTVAATMICAAMAGIRVFATGGIGGVHRGGETSMDVSADLTELAQTPVAVVCAGAKSILDLGRTLEVLETGGVPVLGYGTDVFPAFYTRESDFGVDARVDDPGMLAKILHTKWALGLGGGVLVANPVPKDDAMEPEAINGVIEQALCEADANDIKGKDVTPFLLNRVKQLTGGSSLRANIALVRNNARVAGELAVALSKLPPLS